MSIFSDWQKKYASHGIATFPVRITPDRKQPAISHYGRVGLQGSAKLASKGVFDAFGFMTGARSNVTVLDVDIGDERVLSDALARHGETPLVVRSGSGKYHAYYRHNGERRRIRPWRGLPIDLLGEGGLVVAPPSKATEGRQYEIIQGGLDDLDRLPVLRDLDFKPNGVKQGARNDTLWRHCMRNAHHIDTFEELLDVARTANDNFLPPMEDAEVIKIAHSAWGYTERGDNRFGQFGAYVPIELVNRLATVNPDALALLNVLKAHNGPNSVFPIANAMAATAIALGWRRLAKARKLIVDWGLVEQVSPQTRHRPAQYRWPRTKAGGA